MNKNLFRIICASMMCLLIAIVGFAQDDSTLSSAAGDLYVISAKAGGVNYVEGKALVQRSTGESGYLVKGDTIKVGDKVSTDSNSRAEILLNPGSFLRLDQNSEFEFFTTSLDDLKLQVNRGSAIIEVFASDDFKVTVTTAKATFYLINTGVYRVDVLNNGIGKIEIHRGKARIGNASADSLKKGRTATVNENDVEISKFDRGNTDVFEDWSKSRAKLIAKANEKLSKDRLSNTLLSGNRVDCFNSFGLWVLNRRYNSYSFLPFGYGWRSPYGFGLGTSTSICEDPYYRNYRVRPRGGSGGTTSTNTIPAENVRRAERQATPPFQRIQNSGNVQVRRTNPNNFPTMTTRRSRTTLPSTNVTVKPSRTAPPLSNPNSRSKDN